MGKVLLPLVILKLWTLRFFRVSAITCYVGYGQRGLEYTKGLSWVRYCPLTEYCFEVVTDDITKMQKLIDYPWDSYYYEYYIRSCGGDFGTPLVYHPYKGNPAIYRTPKYIKLNITTETVITGHGGTEVMSLNYICRHPDLCNSAFSFRREMLVIISFIAIFACSLLLLIPS